MKILKITEQEDGSADMEIVMSEEEMRLLIEYAIRHIVKDYIGEIKT